MTCTFFVLTMLEPTLHLVLIIIFDEKNIIPDVTLLILP